MENPISLEAVEKGEVTVATDSEAANDAAAVFSGLEAAAKYGLEVEVVLWALKHAKAHPESSIEDCMAHGVNEWIK